MPGSISTKLVKKLIINYCNFELLPFQYSVTLNPNSVGFSGSKSYRAVQHGCCLFWKPCCGWDWCTGVRAGEFLIGDATGDTTKKTAKFIIKKVVWKNRVKINSY